MALDAVRAGGSTIAKWDCASNRVPTRGTWRGDLVKMPADSPLTGKRWKRTRDVISQQF